MSRTKKDKNDMGYILDLAISQVIRSSRKLQNQFINIQTTNEHEKIIQS